MGSFASAEMQLAERLFVQGVQLSGVRPRCLRDARKGASARTSSTSSTARRELRLLHVVPDGGGETEQEGARKPLVAVRCLHRRGEQSGVVRSELQGPVHPAGRLGGVAICARSAAWARSDSADRPGIQQRLLALVPREHLVQLAAARKSWRAASSVGRASGRAGRRSGSRRRRCADRPGDRRRRGPSRSAGGRLSGRVPRAAASRDTLLQGGSRRPRFRRRRFDLRGWRGAVGRHRRDSTTAWAGTERIASFRPAVPPRWAIPLTVISEPSHGEHKSTAVSVCFQEESGAAAGARLVRQRCFFECRGVFQADARGDATRPVSGRDAARQRSGRHQRHRSAAEPPSHSS